MWDLRYMVNHCTQMTYLTNDDTTIHFDRLDPCKRLAAAIEILANTTTKPPTTIHDEINTATPNQ